MSTGAAREFPDSSLHDHGVVTTMFDCRNLGEVIGKRSYSAGRRSRNIGRSYIDVRCCRDALNSFLVSQLLGALSGP